MTFEESVAGHDKVVERVRAMLRWVGWESEKVGVENVSPELLKAIRKKGGSKMTRNMPDLWVWKGPDHFYLDVKHSTVHEKSVSVKDEAATAYTLYEALDGMPMIYVANRFRVFTHADLKEYGRVRKDSNRKNGEYYTYYLNDKSTHSFFTVFDGVLEPMEVLFPRRLF